MPATLRTRRDFVRSSAALLAALPFRRLSAPSPSRVPDMILYIGTYTSGASRGIYTARLDGATGRLHDAVLAAETPDPSFLTIDAEHRRLYAVNETMTYEEAPGGSVSAFAIDPATGALTALNRQPTRGGAPCYVTLSPSGRHLLVANYAGGNVAVLPVEPDGRLGTPTDVVQHEGTGADPERQEGPHAHCARVSAGGRHVYVADLGIDRVMIYRFDDRAGTLAPADPPAAPLAPGAGPRHLAFHPSGRYAYVINELDSTVTGFAVDARSGALTARQTCSTLPPGFTGTNYGADLHVAPSGRFLYGSNRGHDSIVVFAVGATGTLTYVDHTPTGGHWPRTFAIDPSGRYLLAANERSDAITTFRVDEATGRLTPTGHTLDIPAPVCVAFVPASS